MPRSGDPTTLIVECLFTPSLAPKRNGSFRPPSRSLVVVRSRPNGKVCLSNYCGRVARFSIMSR